MAGSRKSRPADPPVAVRASLARHRIESGRVCVALSGGVDSVVLLHVLHRICRDRPIALSACHVDHGLSPDAGHWADFCAALCAHLGVPCTIRRVDVRPDGDGLEAAARAVRLAALAAEPADVLAFAHHVDDQAETVLYRLLRGCGLRGAGGMAACDARPGAAVVLRPLLGLRRADIEAWARGQGLSWVEDESNRCTTFDRNHIRNVLMPAIQARFPAATERLAAAAERFREGDRLLEQLAAIDWRALAGDEQSASSAALGDLDPARLCNLLRWRIHALGRRSPAHARLAESVRQLAGTAAGPSLRVDLGDTELCRYRGRFWLQPVLPACEQASVPWHGEDRLPWGGGEIRFDRALGRGLSPRILGDRITISVRADGDRLRPRADGPSRAFKALAQAAGVPPWMRARLPVLRLAGRPCWVAELGVDASIACAAGEIGLVPSWRPPAGVLIRLRGIP
ncbi:MAG: tRNA lysidine(34) synthetase TilS [Rhodocyclaceae bacterium]|nr:tRNA lysidine(34) synthetase TilS [Rhodocyclaceae bacterium]